MLRSFMRMVLQRELQNDDLRHGVEINENAISRGCCCKMSIRLGDNFSEFFLDSEMHYDQYSGVS